MKYLLLIVAVLCLFPAKPAAQSAGTLQSSWLHLDKPFYVTDDPLGFQLYLAPEFAGHDIVVQSILFDATGEPELYAYWSNEGNHAVSGKLVIPAELSTGWYYLSFRVWDKARTTERVLLQAPIAIYNDREVITPERVSRREPTRQSAPVDLPAEALTIMVADFPATVASSGSTDLELSVTDRRGRAVAGRVSVSISDWGLMGVAQAMGMENLQGSDSLRVVTPENLSGNLFWRGEYLPENDAARTDQLSLTVGNRKETVRPDAQGRIFRAPAAPPTNTTWQFMTADGEPARVRFRPAAGRLVLGELFHSPAAFRYLEANRQRKTLTSLQATELPSLAAQYQNSAVPAKGPQTWIGIDERRIVNWRYANTGRPAATTLLWYTGQTTTTAEKLKLTYQHPPETTSYRVDIVAQDERGRRGRKTFYYRVE